MEDQKIRTLEGRKFFAGIINGLILTLPFWGFVAYIVWRW